MMRTRELRKEDVSFCSDICAAAFNGFNRTVNLPEEFRPGEADSIYEDALALENIFPLVAVDDNGTVIGSNVADCRDDVGAIGPITVVPNTQNAGAGRMLMQEVIRVICQDRKFKRARLMQISANVKSFSLYLSLGFDPVGNLGHYEIQARTIQAADAVVSRTMHFELLSEAHLDGCDALYQRIEGLSRRNEIKSSILNSHHSSVVLEKGQVIAYTTGAFITGHTVAASIDAFKFLVRHLALAHSDSDESDSNDTLLLHIPHTRPDAARWLVSVGFRLVRQITHMVIGPYSPPRSSALLYCPSINY